MDVNKAVIDSQIHFYEVLPKEKVAPVYKVYQYDDFTFDLLKNKLFYKGAELPISRKPASLFYSIYKRQGAYVKEADLLKETWGDTSGMITRCWVSANLRKIREVLGDDIILTTINKGYSLNLNYEPRIKTESLQVA